MTTKFGEFQEDVRSLSITGIDKKNIFFFNGWSQVYAAKQLMTKYDIESFSEEEQLICKKLLAEFDDVDITRNVRGVVKECLGYPFWPKFPDWEDYEDTEIEKVFREELSGEPHTFKVVDGKLYLMLPEFSANIKKHVDNDEDPHLTIINSDKFDSKDHSLYDGLTLYDVLYDKLSATPVLDYPPFKDVIVVKCTSPTLSKEFGKKEFHYTVKRTTRPIYKL